MRRRLFIELVCRQSYAMTVAVAVAGAFLHLPAQGADTKQKLHGHVPLAASNAQPTGDLDQATELNLGIQLRVREPDALRDEVVALYDPSGPRFHQWLTAEQFTEKYGALKEDYQKVLDFARRNGLTVVRTYEGRSLVDVRGTASQIEKAFHLKMKTYRHPKLPRSFFAPDREPSLDLGVAIERIHGLNNFSRRVDAAAHGDGVGNPIPIIRTSAQIRAAYLPGVTLNGAGQRVAIYAEGALDQSGVTTFLSRGGFNVPVTVVPVGDGFPGDSNGEVSLDVEMAIAMAPGLSEVLVYEPLTENALTVNILTKIADDNRARQISCSFNIHPDSAADAAALDPIFLRFAAQGQSFLKSAGDNGAFPDQVDFTNDYDDNPMATIVGGTDLNTGSGGQWSSEFPWGVSSGGGVSPHRLGPGAGNFSYGIPSWQQGIDMIINEGSTSRRNCPDVSIAASAVLSSVGLAGTSVSAPLWAGFVALVNQQAAAHALAPVGFLNPALYAIGKSPAYRYCFHDITSGNNVNSRHPSGYYAVPGYDLVTGWGSPNGQSLINALAPPDTLNLLPAAGFAASGNAGGPFLNRSQDYTLSNGSSSPLNWSIINTAPWLNVSTTSGTLASHAVTTVTISLSDDARTITTAKTATVLVSNETSHVTQSLQFSLSLTSNQPLVLNSGFDSGDLTGWNVSEAFSSDQVVATPTGIGRNGSGHSLFISGTGGTLSQTIPTIPGDMYQVSVWVHNPDGVVPNLINVGFGNGSYFGDQIPRTTTWSNIVFTALATDPESQIFLSFYLFTPGAMLIDDFTVTNLTPPPSINSVNPKSAATIGGTEITITGSGFTGAPTVLFGEAPASITLNSATTLKVIAPPGVIGPTAVTVINPDGQRRVFNGTFSYQVAPFAEGMPVAANKNASTAITLKGTDFNSPARAITYQFTQPVFGRLSGTPPNLSYVPPSDFVGNDGFTYTVNNQLVDSLPAKVSIKVSANFSPYQLFFQTTYSFQGNEGMYPDSALVQGPDGSYYGTSTYGGSANYGAIYKVSATGLVSPVYSFHNSMDGGWPNGVVIGFDGQLYGTTQIGGAHNGGTAFRLTTTGEGFTTIHPFNDLTLAGSRPSGPLISGFAGDLYGTTSEGGSHGWGTVYRMTRSGDVTILHSFGENVDGTGLPVDGGWPVTGVIQDSDGSLFGTTSAGGNAGGYFPSGNGTLFRVTLGSEFTSLYAFGTDVDMRFPGEVDSYHFYTNYAGAVPNRLLQGADGLLYGTTQFDGANGYGTAFRFDYKGALGSMPKFTVLHTFGQYDSSGNWSDGTQPMSGLTQGADGNFYGTTVGAVNTGPGTVFKMADDGTVTLLHRFGPFDGSLASLVQGREDTLWGVSTGGGKNGYGTVFRLVPQPPGVITPVVGSTPTSAGQNVKVQPIPPTTPGTPPTVELKFDNVQSAGTTTLQVLDASLAPPVPTGFKVAPNTSGQVGLAYFELSTTAHFSGKVQVCFHYDDSHLSLAQEKALTLLHYSETGSQWMELPNQSVDTALNQICADTDTFSPFALVIPDSLSISPEINWSGPSSVVYGSWLNFGQNPPLSSNIPNPQFDDPTVNWYWENWSVSGTAAFDPTKTAPGGSSSSGSLKLTANFVNQAPWQASVFSLPLPQPVNAAQYYTEIGFDLKVDPASIPRAAGDYGFVQVVLRNGDNWDWVDLDLKSLIGTGLQHFTWKLGAAKTPTTSIRAITLVLAQNDLVGPVTVNIDNIAWTAVPLPPIISAAATDLGIPIPGTYTYSPPEGTLLNAGPQTISVTFNPTDSTTYSQATSTFNLTVQKAPLTIKAINTGKWYGQLLMSDLNISYDGFVNGEGLWVLSSVPTAQTAVQQYTPPGVYPITISSVTAQNYDITSVPGNFYHTILGAASPTMVNPANGHRYSLLENSEWFAAEAAAVSRGGHLATIRNQQEQDWVYNTFSHYGGLDRHLWIGLYDADLEHNAADNISRRSEFVWSSGEPVTFSNWGGSEPSGNRYGPAITDFESYGHMFSPGFAPSPGLGGQWNDSTPEDWGFGFGTVPFAPLNGVMELPPLAPIAGPVTNPLNGHIYYLLAQSEWLIAEDAAVRLGGHLATVRNVAEQNFIFQTFGNYGGVSRHLYIGLHDVDPIHNATTSETRKAEFEWVSGEPVTFSNWADFQPDNFNGVGEFWGQMFASSWTGGDGSQITTAGGLWNDVGTSDGFGGAPANGVVEIIMPNVPSANNQVIALGKNTPTLITLSGTQSNSPALSLTYTVTSNPLNGVLSGTLPTITYTPNAGYSGPDSFNFVVSDGVAASQAATVSLIITETGQNLLAQTLVTAGRTATVSVSPEPGQAGVTATLTKDPSGGTAELSVQTYVSNPTPNPIGGPGTSFLDMRVLGANSGDSLTAEIYIGLNPAIAGGGGSGGILVFNHDENTAVGREGNGPWHRALGRPNPTSPPAPVVVPPASGGGVTVTFDGSTSPKICGCISSGFSGTVFAVATIAPPVPGINNWGTVENKPIIVPAVKMLAGAKSLTAGPLSVTGVNSLSVGNGSVSLNAGVITYTPANGFTGQDSFTYTLSDDFENAQGTVNVTVGSSNQQSHNRLAITMNGSCATVGFLGIPGVPYFVQWADSSTGPWTDFLPAITADTSGLISYQDCEHSTARFYRTRLGQ